MGNESSNADNAPSSRLLPNLVRGEAFAAGICDLCLTNPSAHLHYASNGMHALCDECETTLKVMYDAVRRRPD